MTQGLESLLNRKSHLLGTSFCQVINIDFIRYEGTFVCHEFHLLSVCVTLVPKMRQGGTKCCGYAWRSLRSIPIRLQEIRSLK